MKGEKRSEAGWTLVEIMVGIAIVLILMTSVGVVLVGNIYKARQAAAMDHIKTFALALDAYLLDCGEYPTQEQGLKALTEKPILSPVPTGWKGPYLQTLTIPTDPWGGEYEYRVPGPGGLPYGIRSFGADRVEGGEDRNRDIVSWKIEELD
jgi:general secretion pathway protein G